MTDSVHVVPNSPVVLHVVEAYGGGVMNVIHDYVEATPEYTHYILCTARPGHDTGSAVDLDPSRMLILPVKPLAAIRRIRKVVESLRPDIVHAHSSMAGVYVRLCRAVPTRSIFYTPHCFAFERLDIRRPTRGLYRLVERLLVRRTRHFVAVSARELELARDLQADAKGTYVPNIAALPPFVAHEAPQRTVATVGRVSLQKDPHFFLDVVRAASKLPGATDVRWLWLGDGPADLVDPMRDAGVEVSGWLPREEVISRLNSAQVYLHTASWEGSPLSILEAATLGLPMVIRKTPATESLELSDLVETPDEAARAIGQAVHSGGRPEQAPHQDLLARHTTRAQRASLREAYRIAAPIGEDIMSARRSRDCASSETDDFDTASRAAS